MKTYEARSSYLAKLSSRKTVFKHLKTQGILYPCALEKSTNCQALTNQEVRGKTSAKEIKMNIKYCRSVNVGKGVTMYKHTICSAETNHAIKKGEREVGFLIDYCVGS